MADANTSITLQQSQAINGYNTEGQAVGIPTYDENNNLSRYRINPESGELYDTGEVNLVPVTPPEAPVKPGVGAREDSGQTTRATNFAAAQDIQNVKIEPQPNVLDQYVSYTYNLSWFLLNPKSFVRNAVNRQASTFTGATDQKTQLLKNAQLLMRSGGMPKNSDPNSVDVFNVPNKGYISSPEFDVDFYMDNLEIENRIVGKGTGTIHNMVDIKFNVFEPYGITLIPKLYRSVKNLYFQAGIQKKVGYDAALYGMLISFYGYDEAGNLVKAKNPTNSRLTILNSSAVVERFYPFVISDVQFRIANKVTEYQISGRPQPFSINASQDRNSIPAPIQLAGSTIKELMTGRGGPGTESSNVAVDGRTTTSSPSPNANYWADVN